CGQSPCDPSLLRHLSNTRAILLTMTLAEMPYPGDCRPNPEDCEPYHWLADEDRVQDEGNGDQRKTDRNHQGDCAPSQAREIEKPENHRQAPVKRRVPKGVANRQRDEMAMREGEII